MRQTEIRSVREAKKVEVLVSVIDRYLVLLTDTVTVSSLARNQRRDAEVAEGAKKRQTKRRTRRGVGIPSGVNSRNAVPSRINIGDSDFRSVTSSVTKRNRRNGAAQKKRTSNIEHRTLNGEPGGGVALGVFYPLHRYNP